MGTVAELKVHGNEGRSAYDNGFFDGQSARAVGGSLTLYLQIGIDDYARGFRAGFFDRARLDGSADKHSASRNPIVP